MKKKIGYLIALLVVGLGLFLFGYPYYVEANLDKAIQRTSEMYNEKYPKIMLKQDITEGTFKTMYHVTLKGNFEREGIQATTLKFSVLKNGSKVNAIVGFNGETKVWEEKKVFKNNLLKMY